MALTEGQQRFVEEYVKCGNQTMAYRSAFPSERKIMADGQDSSRQHAFALMKNPDIMAAIFRLAKERMNAYAPTAVATLEKLAATASSEAIRLAAATKLLEMSGFKISEKTEITIVDERSDDELEAYILANIGNVTQKLDS